MPKAYYLPTDFFYTDKKPLLSWRDTNRYQPSKRIDENIVLSHVNDKVREFISDYVLEMELENVHLFNTRNSSEIVDQTPNGSKAVINFGKANDYRRINDFFEKVNNKLPVNGLFINKIETHDVRKKRILKNVPKPLRGIFYSVDFVLHRVLPKIQGINTLYFNYTQGYNRVLTRAEILGRLYASGFEIIEDKMINNHLYFVAKKVQEPSYDNSPTYGPMIYLKRVGKEGKIIKVVKLRTMHPYAEYLQQYVFNKNNLSEGGKMKNDFRISKVGRLFRKYWIDELPMLINLFKGEIKLIGVRPLSKQYFSLYPESLRLKRTKYKPGLLPPFYADMPKTLEEIAESEIKYLDSYENNPLLTDFKYLIQILKNIVFAGKRSA